MQNRSNILHGNQMKKKPSVSLDKNIVKHWWEESCLPWKSLRVDKEGVLFLWVNLSPPSFEKRRLRVNTKSFVSTCWLRNLGNL